MSTTRFCLLATSCSICIYLNSPGSDSNSWRNFLSLAVSGGRGFRFWGLEEERCSWLCCGCLTAHVWGHHAFLSLYNQAYIHAQSAHAAGSRQHAAILRIGPLPLLRCPPEPEIPTRDLHPPPRRLDRAEHPMCTCCLFTPRHSLSPSFGCRAKAQRRSHGRQRKRGASSGTRPFPSPLHLVLSPRLPHPCRAHTDGERE